MTARQFIYQLIVTDPVLNSLGITDETTFTQHSLDTPQVRPLCVLRWARTSPGITNSRESPSLRKFPVNQRLLFVWVHDDLRQGDYSRIDRSLKRLRDVLMSVEGVNVGDEGAWLHGINWEGDSDDLRDDALGTIARNATFRLTGSAL